MATEAETVGEEALHVLSNGISANDVNGTLRILFLQVDRGMHDPLNEGLDAPQWPQVPPQHPNRARPWTLWS